MANSWFHWLDPWRRATEPAWVGPLIAFMALLFVLLAILTDPGRYESGRLETLINLALCGYAVVLVLEVGGWHLPRPLFLFFTFAPIALGAYVGRDTIVPLLVMLIVWWVSYTASPRQGRIALLCGLLSIVPPFLVGRGSIDNFFAWSISITVVWLSAYAFAVLRRTVAELRLAQATLARQAAADERRRLAREVHDVVAHSLAITLLHVTGARHILARDPQRAAAALTQAEALGRTSMADLRRTIGLLTTDETSMMAPPTAADIPTLLDTFTQAGLALDQDVSGDLESMPPAAGLDLYRLIQEALTNVAKHAPGSGVSLHLVIDQKVAHLEIVNPLPATPISPEQSSGRGLLGMRERVASYGGRFSAGAVAGKWRVSAELPFSPQSSSTEATETLSEKAMSA
jgi:signal transduction histidine kinase